MLKKNSNFYTKINGMLHTDHVIRDCQNFMDFRHVTNKEHVALRWKHYELILKRLVPTN